MGTFLKAEWQKLVMANYIAEPGLLLPYLPYRTEFDLWNDSCYVSLIGFMFVNTRLKGIKVPFHTNFEEVNLRFYVRYKDNGIWKRGVVFIKEIVPRPALTVIARTFYNEPYVTRPMKHNWQNSEDELEVEYSWKSRRWNKIKILAENKKTEIAPGSEAEFITEHYWGYTKIKENLTKQYGVEHPRWNLHPTINYEIDVDFSDVYGSEFNYLSHIQPTSVFLADGSSIEVKTGSDIR
ncbi:MAG: DUF2071 domain-containing protein [Chryseolinea sp.]